MTLVSCPWIFLNLRKFPRNNREYTMKKSSSQCIFAYWTWAGDDACSICCCSAITLRTLHNINWVTVLEQESGKQFRAATKRALSWCHCLSSIFTHFISPDQSFKSHGRSPPDPKTILISQSTSLIRHKVWVEKKII